MLQSVSAAQAKLQLLLLLTMKWTEGAEYPSLPLQCYWMEDNESNCSSWWFSMPSIKQGCEHDNNYRGLIYTTETKWAQRSLWPVFAGTIWHLIRFWLVDSMLKPISNLDPSLWYKYLKFFSSVKCIKEAWERKRRTNLGGVVKALRAVERSPVSHKCSTLIRVIHFIIRLLVLALSNMQHADVTEEDKKGML